MTTDQTLLTDMPALATHAATMLVLQKPVRIVHPHGWARPTGWPLPVRRQPPGEPTEYRPLSILEYIHAELSGANRSTAQADRMATRKGEAA